MGDVEGHMGQQQCTEAKIDVLLHPEGILRLVEPDGKGLPQAEKGHEQQTHGDAGDDLRIHDGNVVHRHQGRAPPHTGQANGCKGARHSGNQRGKHGYQQRGIDTLHNEAVLEQLRIPVQGEALPHRAAVAGIEGEDDENENRRIQEYEYQRHEDAVSQQMLPFHSITACSSPSPKRFITSIHTTTMAIITSAIAAPSWGL